MQNIEKAEVKRIIGAIKSGKLTAQSAATNGFTARPALKGRHAAAKILESAATKAGIDVRKIETLLAKDQSALRAAFDKQQAQAAKRQRGAEAAFRSGMASRLQALNLLGKPFVASMVTLDKPFLIWQLPNPQLDIFVDSHIESMNSSVNVLVDVADGSNSTRFVFFFLWRNDTDFFAVINVASSIIANGACSVQAARGFFSGDEATLNIAASLTIMRWFGWGTDPVTGQSNDQTAHPNFQATQRRQITALHAEGGHAFQGPGFDSQSFSFEPFPLSHNLLVVPNNASVIFQVAAEFSYGFEDGLHIEDRISADFSNNGRRLFCPNVELEILTPISSLTMA